MEVKEMLEMIDIGIDRTVAFRMSGKLTESDKVKESAVDSY